MPVKMARSDFETKGYHAVGGVYDGAAGALIHNVFFLMEKS